ncbi:YhaN family protein [Georhizobium profundi]|uniref:YhaN family protein n=1 Tax=Georhizobium profundi TaxID=2341112 RepID=UPI0013DF9E23|nr:YhaN family protein [Georhizobium profundi]
MRLLRLHLLRYGALTDRVLEFRPDARLHVVYGQNEAGKSSALSSLSDLFFGFPHHAHYAFLHNAQTLRLAATIRARSGDELSFRRRRGKKDTLLADDEAETPLKDDALAPFLGGLSRPVFERAFGLDSERLRLGSRAMLDADGEAGDLLFAASAGILGLRQVKTAMDEEANALFTPRAAAGKAFYQVLARHEEARRLERDHELRAGDWKSVNDAIDDLTERHAAKVAERTELRRREQGLVRLNQLRPILAEIDREREQLRAFADLDHVPEGQGSAISAALATLRQANERVAAAEKARERAEAKRADIAIDVVYLDHGDAIAELLSQSASHLKDLRDLPRVTGERDDFSRLLEDLAHRLGLVRSDLDRLQPTDMAIAGLAERAAAARQAAERVALLDERLAAEMVQASTLEAQATEVAAIDPRPWLDRLEALRPDIELLGDVDSRTVKLETERRRIAEAVSRLVPPVKDLDALAKTSLPEETTLAAQRDRMRDLQQGARVLQDRIDRERVEIDALEAEARAEAHRGVTASPAAIHQARSDRDGLFREIAASLTGEAPPIEPAIAAVSIGRYRSAVTAADALADAALEQSDRLAEAAAKSRRREDLLRSHAALLKDLETDEAAQAKAQAEFARPFSSLGLAAGSPDEMIVWSRALAALLAARQALLEEEDRLASLKQTAQQLREPLELIGRGIRLEGSESLPLRALDRGLRERLRQLGEAWDASRDLAARKRDTARRVEDLRERRAASDRSAQEALAALQAETARLGLFEPGTPAETEAALALWKKVPDLRREEDNRARRVAGIERDIRGFRQSVEALVSKLDASMSGFPPAEAIRVFHDRAQAARTADTMDRQARQDISEAEEGLSEANAARVDAEERLAALVAGFGQAPDADAIAGRLIERDGLRVSLSRCRSRLGEVAAGEDEASIRAAIQEADRDAALPDLAQLSEDIHRLDGEVDELFAQLAAEKARREGMMGAKGAELAAFERKAAEAELVQVARQWAVLKFGSLLLGAAMERQRAAQSNPMLQRAGALFSAITEGRFDGLRQQFDENDRPTVVAVRSNADFVGASGMSDGTRDQLYLALRLSYLEDYAERNEPAPFIADDIFQTFDDERTLATLKVLGETSERIQPIVFTHHGHVVELARAALGSALDVVEL